MKTSECIALITKNNKMPVNLYCISIHSNFPMTRSVLVCRSAGLLVRHISQKGWKFHFHAPIAAGFFLIFY